MYLGAIEKITPDFKEIIINTTKEHERIPFSLDRLRKVVVSYYDFKGNVHNDGVIITIDVAADSVRTIFQELFKIKFPLAKIRPINEYNGDDEASMEDNNSSCFNFRPILYKDILSIHSYGLAIDINPEINPYVILDENKQIKEIYPKAGKKWLDRSKMKAGMVEYVRDIFENNGFTVWGGKWEDMWDYHHFQTPRFVAELIGALPLKDGRMVFQLNKTYKPKKEASSKELLEVFNQNPEEFYRNLGHVMREK